jgi:cobalt-zinc-cadmium efflux system protein
VKTTIRSKAERGLLLAILLSAVTLVLEIAGGILSGSLALLSDAVHVLLDLLSLLLSYGAIRVAMLPPTDTRTFGWHRVEVFASLTNGLTMLAASLWILYEAWGRYNHPVGVETGLLFVVAIVGLVLNGVSAAALHRGAEGDLNVRSAFLHVMGDTLSSVGVVVGAVVMAWTGWYRADALISAGIGLVVLWGTGGILREALRMLLEGTPPGLDAGKVSGTIRAVEGVDRVHRLHLWSLCSHIPVLSAHVEISSSHASRPGEVLEAIRAALRAEYRIEHVTLQPECGAECTLPTAPALRHEVNKGDASHQVK